MCRRLLAFTMLAAASTADALPAASWEPIVEDLADAPAVLGDRVYWLGADGALRSSDGTRDDVRMELPAQQGRKNLAQAGGRLFFVEQSSDRMQLVAWDGAVTKVLRTQLKPATGPTYDETPCPLGMLYFYGYGLHSYGRYLLVSESVWRLDSCYEELEGGPAYSPIGEWFVVDGANATVVPLGASVCPRPAAGPCDFEDAVGAGDHLDVLVGRQRVTNGEVFDMFAAPRLVRFRGGVATTILGDANGPATFVQLVALGDDVLMRDTAGVLWRAGDHGAQGIAVPPPVRVAKWWKPPVVAAGRFLVVTGYDGANHEVGYLLDADAGTMTRVDDAIGMPGAEARAEVAGSLLFTGTGVVGTSGLFRYEGTPGAITRLLPEGMGLGPFFPSPCPSVVLFRAIEHSGAPQELWRTDGTAAGTVPMLVEEAWPWGAPFIVRESLVAVGWEGDLEALALPSFECSPPPRPLPAATVIPGAKPPHESGCASAPASAWGLLTIATFLGRARRTSWRSASHG